VAETAEKLYTDFLAAGFEVLFDDREESPGVKFNDADLLGIPLRVTVSPRTLEKASVEFKKRSEKQAEIVPLGEIAGNPEAIKVNLLHFLRRLGIFPVRSFIPVG
jgi:prolyl-tRNA synthetase